MDANGLGAAAMGESVTITVGGKEREFGALTSGDQIATHAFWQKCIDREFAREDKEGLDAFREQLSQMSEIKGPEKIRALTDWIEKKARERRRAVELTEKRLLAVKSAREALPAEHSAAEEKEAIADAIEELDFTREDSDLVDRYQRVMTNVEFCIELAYFLVWRSAKKCDASLTNRDMVKAWNLTSAELAEIREKISFPAVEAAPGQTPEEALAEVLGKDADPGEAGKAPPEGGTTNAGNGGGGSVGGENPGGVAGSDGD